MAVHLSCLLILTGLTGINGITTVSKVSVKAGNSISIPCLYDSQYSYHVKYLCKGYTWNSCPYEVKTNEANSEKFLISDDITQSTFTVTIKDLTYEDAHYWCAVEINRGWDVGERFHLLFTTDTPSLYVDRQQVRAFEGGDVTINCYHNNSGETSWCRLGGSCVTSSGSIDGTRVSIKTKTSSLFTVTMSGLKMKSSGWYLCVKGDLQMPVHLTVDERPTTTTHATTTTTTTTTTRLTTVSTTKTTRLTTVSTTRECVNVNLITYVTDPQDGPLSSSSPLTSFICRLSLLVVFVMINIFIWFMFKRHMQNEESSATTKRQEEVTFVRKTSDEVTSPSEFKTTT